MDNINSHKTTKTASEVANIGECGEASLIFKYMKGGKER